MKAFPEPPVDGINTWLMSAARWCQTNGMSNTETANRLLLYDGGLRRRLKTGEVERAVERVFATTLDRSALQSRKLELPTWNAKETARLHAEYKVDKDMLRESSRDELPETWHPYDILCRLFPDHEGLLCVGESMSRFHTAPLRDHSFLRRKQLIVPCYMTARTGLTQEGKVSAHTKANTGPRRYIVCDFDSPPPEQHPSIIHHLARFRPLTMALSSGGKSIHAWFPTTANKDDDKLFWRLCITLGADPVLCRNRSQFVRMPNGTRDNGNRQRRLYLNFSAIP
jgi:hypothetical protein